MPEKPMIFFEAIDNKRLLRKRLHMNPLLPLRAAGLLGGTFDPVHEGHLAIARAVGAHFALDQVRLIPAREPVHRSAPTAGAHHRLAMLRLAVAPYPELVVDTREFDSSQQNYTWRTLQSLRAEQPDASLLWIIGEDAFAQLPAWRRWQELFDMAHFVVINRDRAVSGQVRTLFTLSPRGRGYPEGAGEGERPPLLNPSPPAPLPQELAPEVILIGGERGAKHGAMPEILQAAVAPRLTENKQALTSRPAGLVYHLTLPPQPASGTQIRAALAAGRADDIAGLLPAPVLAYIASQTLYR
jgi:nicotinate-nucleotide adenylyltransferase